MFRILLVGFALFVVNIETTSSDSTNRARSPSAMLLKFNHPGEKVMSAEKLETSAAVLTHMKEQYINTMGISKEKINELIAELKKSMENRTSCPPRTNSFRTVDGTCNNVEKTEQGSAGTVLIRVVKNAYDDGFNTPRTKSVTGKPLPSAREVSRAVFTADTQSTRTNRDLTVLQAHFGQITDHDLTAVPLQKDPQCPLCSTERECLPIPILRTDPLFNSKRPCFNFSRSDFENDCFDIRQHINSITTYLDASFAYGSNEKLADELRLDSGLLKHRKDEVTKRDLLPDDTVDEEQVCPKDDDRPMFCSLAGDVRVSEQPGLTALQTLFLREHNRVASELKSLSPSTCSEAVYEKARKIVGAEWQHIVYNEYLPLIINRARYIKNKLSPSAPYQYDPEVDASISNVFATAAFRYGHTTVPSNIKRADKSFKMLPDIDLNDAFFNPRFIFDTSISDGAVDSILRGMTFDDAPKVDGSFANALISNLFGGEDQDGFDLTALNIQRGREHGLPGYTKFRREVCHLKDFKSFNDPKMRRVFKTSVINKLKRVYGKDGLQDMDAFVGFVLEKNLPNAIVGPTLSCIFADQFRRLKFGDRFFYKNPDVFTDEERNEIEKATMARLMCDNVHELPKIQPYVFAKPKRFRGRNGSKGWTRSFSKYTKKSSVWPSKKGRWLYGLDNRRVKCESTKGHIPVVDLRKFI